MLRLRTRPSIGENAHQTSDKGLVSQTFLSSSEFVEMYPRITALPSPPAGTLDAKEPPGSPIALTGLLRATRRWSRWIFQRSTNGILHRLQGSRIFELLWLFDCAHG
jgi:hypothetical protein